jgi:glycosyltransferase involved in cell wall biosynthesis
VLFWNANNPYSFDRIDWPRLAFTNTITAVSRHMRSIIRTRGVDALVIPNGIPGRMLQPVPRRDVAILRARLSGTRLFFKMARWEREKGWTQALDAIARLRDRGRRAVLVGRSGGPGGPGEGLRGEAEGRGLDTYEASAADAKPERLADIARSGVHVVSLRFGVTEPLARTLYAASEAVIANSVSEPFGLVGLEAMAAGGVVFTGGTGEDYAVSGRNSVVLETLDPDEIANRSDELAASPALEQRLRRAARATARRYTWSEVAQHLIGRLEDQARRQGLLAAATRPAPRENAFAVRFGPLALAPEAVGAGMG